MAKKKDKSETLSFEEAVAGLSEVVRELEEGKLSLEDSLGRYEQGVRLLKQCQTILAATERKIEVLSGVDADGNPVTRRFDDEELTLQEKAEQRSRRRTASPKKKRAPANPPAENAPPAEDVDEHGTLF